MTNPDNDNPLHESVRQKLADYQPPFDPENWQRMRRKLRRDRRRPLVWVFIVTLILIGSVWYAIKLRPKPFTAIKRPSSVLAQPKRLTGSGIPTPDKAANVTTPKRTAGKKTLSGQVSLPARIKPFADLTQLASHLEPLLPVNYAYELPPVLVHSPAEPDIIKQVTMGTVGADSTTYRVLSRNISRWSNAVVVCDFTSSMYLYSTQLMAWFRKNQANEQVKGIVFFTDCDSLGRETGPNRPGQVFATRSRAINDVLPLMLASARNTMGNVNDAENNIEALVYAQRQFPEASQLILVADNSSTVKDLNRLPELHKPVHIILCGPTFDTARAFQPDYYTIALQTGGSLHTLEDDLTNVGQLRPNTWIQVDRRYYRLNRRGRFVATNFRHRPRRLLGLFWR